MIPYTLFPAILGILGLGSAWLVYLYVKNSPEGDGKVKEIADEILRRRKYAGISQSDWFSAMNFYVQTMDYAAQELWQYGGNISQQKQFRFGNSTPDNSVF